MKEKRKIFALLLDELVLTGLYFIFKFQLRYFLIFISLLVLKDIFIIIKAWEILNRENLLGTETLINRVGVVLEEIDPYGQIKIGREIWKVESDERIEEGEKVIVASVHGLCLKVKKYRGEDNERKCME